MTSLPLGVQDSGLQRWCIVYVRVLELNCVTCGAATWKNLKLETKGGRFPVHASSRTSCGCTIGRELCSKESYWCSSRSVHPSCPVLTEGQNRCCIVNLLVHVWRLHVYASNRTGKKQCSKKIAEFLSRVLLGACAGVIAWNRRQNPYILIWLGPGQRTGRRRRGSVTCTETSPIQSQWRFRSDCLLPSEIGTSWCGRILHSMAFVLFCLYLSKKKKEKEKS